MPHDEGVAAMTPPAHSVRSRFWILCWVFPAVSFYLGLFIGERGALTAPDSLYYRLLALGQRGAVPSPFSARILGPAIAGWLGRITGRGVDYGFLLLGLISLTILLASLLGLLRVRMRSSVGLFAGFCAAIFLLPFWGEIFRSFYLPDLLHATLLAVMLLCLASGRSTLAMALLFPLFLARESTILISFCLAWAAWRRVPMQAVAAGVLATAGGLGASRHFDRLGIVGEQGLHGGLYALGKVVWNLPRNLFGLAFWTNTLSPCGPIWVTNLPSWLPVGKIHQFGFCGISLWGPSRLFLAWLGVFGVGPAILIALWRPLFAYAGSSPRIRPEDPMTALSRCGTVVYRFALFYGVISLLLAPALGASVDRLVSYGWPLYFVALPWFLLLNPAPIGRRGLWILTLHLLTCWVAWLGFRSWSIRGYCLAAGGALVLNGLVYFLVDRSAVPESLSMPGRRVYA